MVDGGRGLQAASRSWDVRSNRAGWIDRKDDRLEIFLAAIDREHERRRLAAANRAAQNAVDDAALLGRPFRRERIACVQAGVPEYEVERSMVGVCARFRDHLNPPSARPHEFSGV